MTLSNNAIAMLCEIGAFSPDRASAEQKEEIEKLVAGGYVESDPASQSAGYKLTGKGITFLGDRGAGLNEA